MVDCKVFRIILHVLAVITMLTAVILTAIALTSPRWQRVELTETKQVHLHGLYEDCVYNIKTLKWTCEYKLFDSDLVHDEDERLHVHDNGVSHKHTPSNWQLIVICLMSAAAICGILAVIFGISSSCVDCCHYNVCLQCLAMLSMVLSILPAVLSAAAVIIFFKKSYDIANRIILDRTENSEQHYDSAFTIAIAGCICFLAGMVLSIMSVIFMCVLRRMAHSEGHKTFPKFSSHNTAV